MSDSILQLRSAVEGLYATSHVGDATEARRVFADFRARLTSGEIRAAEKIVGENGEARWITNPWIKQGILLGFRLGVLKEMSDGEVFTFIDKDTFPARRLTLDD